MSSGDGERSERDRSASDRDWTVFELTLAWVFRSFPERTYLVIASEAGAGVQCTTSSPDDPWTLYTEVFAQDFAPDLEAELRGLGLEPSMDYPAWKRTIPFPSASAAYADVARASVLAARYGFGLASPHDLHYRAWRDGEPLVPGRSVDPDSVRWGESRVEFPELDLRYES